MVIQSMLKIAVNKSQEMFCLGDVKSGKHLTDMMYLPVLSHRLFTLM